MSQAYLDSKGIEYVSAPNGIGVEDFDYDLAWQAVRKNAYTPPDSDTELR